MKKEVSGGGQVNNQTIYMAQQMNQGFIMPQSPCGAVNRKTVL